MVRSVRSPVFHNIVLCFVAVFRDTALCYAAVLRDTALCYAAVLRDTALCYAAVFRDNALCYVAVVYLERWVECSVADEQFARGNVSIGVKPGLSSLQGGEVCGPCHLDLCLARDLGAHTDKILAPQVLVFVDAEGGEQ
uniref:Uncharacterized protein n=1 Tax=Timema genevievae TaxID=629358 RepID=A0A7R9JQD7_TIMGE|nr:unnamed protein product [Timema genevievae]